MKKITLLLAAFLTACTSQQHNTLNPIFYGNQSHFESYIDQYKALEGKKALAIALAPDGQWAVGYYYDCEKQFCVDQACVDQVALQECESSKAKYGVDAACVVRARSNEEVEALRPSLMTKEAVIKRLEAATVFGQACVKKSDEHRAACAQFHGYLREYFKQDGSAVTGPLKAQWTPDEFIEAAGLVVEVSELMVMRMK